MESEFVSVPKRIWLQMELEIKTLRNAALYKRLLEFEKNVSEGKKFTRKDLGF